MSKQPVSLIILGAGAAGLFCAWQAAQLGLSVLVLDHANKAGKKILMSGGGKCNFTNTLVESDAYISQNPHFCKSALSRFTNWDFIALIEAHGIAYEERKHGQLFCTNSAKDVLNMLLAGCKKHGVQVQCHTEVQSIKALTNTTTTTPEVLACSEKVEASTVSNTTVSSTTSRQCAGFELTTSKGAYFCKKLVVATGGLSIPTMGATGFGYEVAAQFGHRLIPRTAGLVPFTFTDRIGDLCKRLTGNALEVTARNTRISFTEAMLFTHRGLSGPVMLQLSSYWQAGEAININLLPKLNASDWLIAQKQTKPKALVATVLSSKLPKRVAVELATLLFDAYIDTPLGCIPDDVLATFGDCLNDWRIKPAGTEGYRTAEVTLGGVCVDDISSKTMQSLLQPNLYFIGEVLDVTGWLGGYNFQWAWASGYACAQSIYSDLR